MSARIEYVPGEAWCVASGRVVLVCERDLGPARATRLHAEARSVDSVDALRALVESEPTALIGLVDLDGRRALLRRHGVPAAAAEAPLPDRYGPEWSADELPADASIAAGGLGALSGDTLPLEGGVVRVAAVRVAPRAADASAHDAERVAVDDTTGSTGLGAFGQTLPPAAVGEARTAAPTVPAPVTPEQHATQEPAAEPVPESSAPEVPEPMAPAPEVPEPVAPAPEVPTDTGNPIGGLIDSVPGFIKPAFDVRGVEVDPARAPEPANPAEPPHASVPVPTATPAASAPAPGAAAAAASAPAPETQATSAPAAPAASAPAPAPATGAGSELGDHDGMTVTADQARQLAADRRQAEGPAAVPATGPLVLSTVCPSGHVNAPGTTLCTSCGAPVDEGSAAQRRRPEVAVAVLPSGERIPLGRGVIVGRRPRTRRVEDGRVPRLVTVDSPGEDISRSHVELRVEDWNLVAVDLSSTNGTLLLREGAPPQRLRPEASTILQLGDRLDLGEAVVLTIEAAP